MATQPTDKLVRVAELDTTLPIAGGANKIEPESLILTTGYDDDQAVFAQDLNYIFDNLAQWISYSQERIDELVTQVEKERVSVGEIIEITGDSTNPFVLKGYGTWESFGQGQVLVGVGEHTDDRSESKTWADGDSEGKYKHVQTVSEIAQHTPSVTAAPHSHRIFGSTIQEDTSNPLGGNSVAGEGDPDAEYTTLGSGGNKIVEDTTINLNVGSIGSSSPMNNIQPSTAVYRWKRTA